MSTVHLTWQWAQVCQLALIFAVQPLAECMGAKEEARQPALYSLPCIKKWNETHLKQIVHHFNLGPYNSPLIYLEVSNTTLFGAPDDFQRLYRRLPQSYLIQTVEVDVGRYHLYHLAHPVMRLLVQGSRLILR